MSQPIVLTDGERRMLQVRVQQASEPGERERCQAVLLAAEGVAQQVIGHGLGRSVRCVQRHLMRYRREGLGGMPTRKAPGKPARIPASLEPEVLRWVEAGPQAVGARGCVTWTHAHLARHLRAVHGVQVARATMGEWCRRHGVRPYRPSYRFLRADAQARAAAEALLAKKKPQPSAAR